MTEKLLRRLRDPARSGVYRVASDDTLAQALAGTKIDLARVDLGAPLFEAFSRALGFPDWFGGNWDALEDCLTDLSWREAAGHVVLLEGGLRLKEHERSTLLDVLAAAAAFWAGENRPFFAVFVDPRGELALPELFRGA